MTAWLIQTLVSATVLMLLVLAVRRPVAKAFGARIAYALWALPALRMVLPTLPGHRQLFVPVLIASPGEAPVRIGLAPPESVTHALVLPRAIADAPMASALDWPTMILAAWALGALLWFGWQMLRYAGFMRRAMASATPIAEECGIAILTSDHVTGPVAAGIARRRIFLPRDFVARYSSSERRQALLHEGAHHDRLDIVANFAALVVLAVHWWNPIAHCAYRAFRSDQELACDATVLERMGPDERYAYGSALVKSSGGRFAGTACALDRAEEIKRRLKMIKRGTVAAPRRYAGALIAIAAIGGGLLVTASGSAVAEAARQAVRPVAAILPIGAVAPVAAVAPVVAAQPAPAVRVAMVAPAAPVAAPAPAAGPATPADPDPNPQPSKAQEDAMAAAFQHGDDAEFSRLISAQVESAMAQARAEMAKACVEKGKPVPAGSDWSALALCGDNPADFRREAADALREARDEVSRDKDIPDRVRASLLASLDREIDRQK